MPKPDYMTLHLPVNKLTGDVDAEMVDAHIHDSSQLDNYEIDYPWEWREFKVVPAIYTPPQH